jgi:hypothetical protein
VRISGSEVCVVVCVTDMYWVEAGSVVVWVCVWVWYWTEVAVIDIVRYWICVTVVDATRVETVDVDTSANTGIGQPMS